MKLPIQKMRTQRFNGQEHQNRDPHLPDPGRPQQQEPGKRQKYEVDHQPVVFGL